MVGSKQGRWVAKKKVGSKKKRWVAKKRSGGGSWLVEHVEQLARSHGVSLGRGRHILRSLGHFFWGEFFVYPSLPSSRLKHVAELARSSRNT